MGGFQEFLIIRIKRRRQLDRDKLLLFSVSVLIIEESLSYHMFALSAALRLFFRSAFLQDSVPGGHFTDKFRICSTAATENVSTELLKLLHLLRKIYRSVAKLKFISRQSRISRIRDRQQEFIPRTSRFFQDLAHMSRSHAAV